MILVKNFNLFKKRRAMELRKVLTWIWEKLIMISIIFVQSLPTASKSNKIDSNHVIHKITVIELTQINIYDK
jgi:hypothetical protein